MSHVYITSLPLATTRLLHASHTISSVESALAALVQDAVQAGATRIVVTLHPSSLRFSVWDDTSPFEHAALHTALTTARPRHPSPSPRSTLCPRAHSLLALAATSSLDLRTRGAACAMHTHLRFGTVLDHRTSSDSAGATAVLARHGLQVDVWESFSATPVRRRLETARRPSELCSAVRSTLLPLALANPQVAVVLHSDAPAALLATSGGLAAPTSDLVRVLRAGPAGAIWHSAAVATRDDTHGRLRARAVVATSVSAPRVIALDGVPLNSTRLHAAARAQTGRDGERLPLGYVVDIRCDQPQDMEHRLTLESKMDDGPLPRLVAASVRAALRDENNESVVRESRARRRRGVKRCDIPPAKRPRFAEALLSVNKATSAPVQTARELPMVRRATSAAAVDATLRRVSGMDLDEVIWSGAPRASGMRMDERFDKRDVSVSREMLAGMRVVGQVDRKFVMMADERGVYALDQHAASERFLFERLRARAARRGGVVAVALRNRTHWMLGPELQTVVEERGDALRRWGWRVTVARDGVEVTHVPCVTRCGGQGVVLVERRCLTDFLQSVVDGATASSLPRPVGDVVATTACHSAVRFGDELSRAQCESLVRSLRECDNPFVCAHGRPSIVPLVVFDEVSR